MANGAPNVTITFEGIMVFRLREGDPFGEVGILPSPDHGFRARIVGTDGTDRPIPLPAAAPKEVWSLNVPVSPFTVFHDNRPNPRTSPPQSGKLAFDWFVDWERDLYTTQQTRHKKVLGPIFHLTAGEFYTELMDTEHQFSIVHPDGHVTPFGFVAEVLGFGMHVDDSINLEMRSETTGRPIFSIPRRPGAAYQVRILNTPTDVDSLDPSAPQMHDHLGPSHLQLYYLLFSKDGDERFEFPPAVAPQPFFCGGLSLSQTTTKLSSR